VSLALARRQPSPPPWEALLEAADRKQSRMSSVFLEAAHMAQAALDLDAVDAAFDAGQQKMVEYHLGFCVAVMTTHLGANVPAVIVATMAAGAESAAKDARHLGRFRTAELRDARDPRFDDLHFDLVNPEAVRWAAERSSRLIVGITDEVRAAIRSIIARSFTEGLTTKGSARLIRELIGLTDGYARAVLNLRLKMLANPGKKLWAGSTPIRVPKSGATWDFLVRRAEQYAQRLLNLRARAIARTETIAASNEGQRQLWLQAQRRGLLSANEAKQWIVTPDDRLCPICEAINGEVQYIDQPFSVGVMGPPAHALCRCTVGLSRKKLPVRVDVPMLGELTA